MSDIKQALVTAINLLNHHEEARIDTEILLMHVLQQSKTFLYAHPEAQLTSEQWQQFTDLIKRRLAGMPISYLTGQREFWSLALKVNENTLIPRAETELLVELTLKFLSPIKQAHILELGTGSGAIALALAHERPDWYLYAVDYSQAALDIARENALYHQLNNIHFIHSNWFNSLEPTQTFHAIISNPPYIASEDPHLNQGDLRFEPSTALVSGNTGLDDLEHIIQHGFARLKDKGLLLVEHGYNQHLAVNSMLNKYGYQHINCWQDWQGINRVSGGWANNS